MEIKLIRDRLKLSQEAFARLIGVSMQTVNRWENGRFKPSLMAMEKINTLLNQEATNERNKLC